MTALAKLGIVTAGYVAAFAFASMALQVYVASTPAVDRTSGMSAFGDSAYFLAAYGIAAVPATGVALYFLRPCKAFWATLSVGSLVAGVITLVAAAISLWHLASQHAIAALSPLWILATPLVAGGFVLAGLFAPSRSGRFTLLGASAVQAAAFVCVMVSWFHPAAR